MIDSAQGERIAAAWRKAQPVFKWSERPELQVEDGASFSYGPYQRDIPDKLPREPGKVWDAAHKLAHALSNHCRQPFRFFEKEIEDKLRAVEQDLRDLDGPVATKHRTWHGPGHDNPG
jgi:hypothetical protein